MKVEINSDYITITNDEGYEVCHWISDEWEEDPFIVPAIANAIRMASVEPGRLEKINKAHIETQKRYEKLL